MHRCRNSNLLAAPLVGILSFCALDAHAVDGFHPELGIAQSGRDFQYKEYNDAGVLLDREDGRLPGIAFEAGVIWYEWFARAELQYHAGVVTYRGQTNVGIPVESRTDTIFTDTELHAGRHFVLAKTRLTPYASVGYHYWDRDIRGTRTASGLSVSGLHETYDWYSIGLGGLAAIGLGVHARIGVDARIFRTHEPKMRLHGNGARDPITLDLGERYGWRVGMPFDYSFNKNIRFDAELSVTGWEFGRSSTKNLTSGGTPVAAVYEPRSETVVSGVTLGLLYRF